jgi:hypothetical protein
MENGSHRDRRSEPLKDFAPGDLVVGGISDNDLKVVLDRALRRESRYFRLTEGQRSALGVKRSR